MAYMTSMSIMRSWSLLLSLHRPLSLDSAAQPIIPSSKVERKLVEVNIVGNVANLAAINGDLVG